MAPTIEPTKKGKRSASGTTERSAKRSASATTERPAKKAKVGTKDADRPLPLTFKVVAGSYEKLLYGLEGSVSGTSEEGYTFSLRPLFMFPAHISCIKAVGVSPFGGKWLASGASDEVIKIWDLRRHKEVGSLLHHSGSITSLCFLSASYLLSGSEDGELAVFHTRDWVVVRRLRGHKGRVNCVCVHPSGKVALSVGKDQTIRMWDLMRGKGVASVKLGKEGEVVRFSSTGSHFAVQNGKEVDIYDSHMTLLRTITHSSRIHDVHFYGDEDHILVAAEDKHVTLYSLEAQVLSVCVGHENRVKSIQTLRIALPDGHPTTILATASSDGRIHLYNLSSLSKQLDPVAVYDSKGTRLTCLTIADSTM